MKSKSKQSEFYRLMGSQAPEVLQQLALRRHEFEVALHEEFLRVCEKLGWFANTSDEESFRTFVYALVRATSGRSPPLPDRDDLREDMPRLLDALNKLRQVEELAKRPAPAGWLAIEAEALFKQGLIVRARAIQDELQARLDADYRGETLSEVMYFEILDQFQHRMSLDRGIGGRFVEQSAQDWIAGEVYRNARQLMLATRCFVPAPEDGFEPLVAELANGFIADLPPALRPARRTAQLACMVGIERAYTSFDFELREWGHEHLSWNPDEWVAAMEAFRRAFEGLLSRGNGMGPYTVLRHQLVYRHLLTFLPEHAERAEHLLEILRAELKTAEQEGLLSACEYAELHERAFPTQLILA